MAIIDVITEEMLDEIKSYISPQLEDSEAQIQQRKEDYSEYRRHRAGQPKEKVSNYPFENAAVVTVPAMRTVTNTMYGKTNAVFGQRVPFWTVKAQRDDAGDEEKARVLTNYLDIISKGKYDLDLKKKRQTIEYEAISMPACIVKVPFTDSRFTFKEETEAGERTVEVTQHLGPEIVPIMLEDFLFPSGWDNVQDMPWCAHRLHLPEYELRLRADSGRYNDEVVEKLLKVPRRDPSEVEERQDDLWGEESITHHVYDLLEIYMYWDVDGDGLMEDIIVTYSMDTGDILRIDFNNLGTRPFRAAKFQSEPFRFLGVGTGQICQHLQEEIDTLHRMRINNAHFSGLRMFIMKRGAGSAGKKKEKLYPGKIFYVDNPREDIQPLQAGEIYPSSLQAENLAFMYMQKAVGASDTMAGFADQTMRTRDSIGGQMLRLQQGQGIFNAVIEGLEETYSELGMLIVHQLINNRDVVMRKEREIQRMKEADLDILEECLSIPKDKLPLMLNVRVKTTNIEETQDVKRQNKLALFQIYTQYGQLAMQNAQFLPDPSKAQELAVSLFVGATDLVEDIMKFMGDEAPEDKLPSVLAFKYALQLKDLQEAMQLEPVKEQIDELRRQKSYGGGAIQGEPGGQGTPIGGAPAFGQAQATQEGVESAGIADEGTVGPGPEASPGIQ